MRLQTFPYQKLLTIILYNQQNETTVCIGAGRFKRYGTIVLRLCDESFFEIVLIGP